MILTPNLTAALHSREYRRLYSCPVHAVTRSLVARFAADIRFVALDNSCQWRGGWKVWGHCKANAIHQEQGRLVADLAVASESPAPRRPSLKCRHARTHKPNGASGNAGFFVDRADANGVLLFAVLAAPQITACCARPSWRQPSCRLRRCRTSHSTGRCPNAASQRTPQRQVHRSKRAGISATSLDFRQIVAILFHDSNFIHNAMIASSKKFERDYQRIISAMPTY